MTTNRVRVGDVLTLRRRPVEVRPDGTYEEIGLRSFGRGVFHKPPVPGTTIGSKRLFAVEAGDLLLSNVFAWEGAVALAGQGEHGRVGSHRFMSYTPADGRVDIGWAAWFFRSEAGLALLRDASPGSAGRNRTLAIGRFENLSIPLPNVELQRRVAARLDRIAATTLAVMERTRDATRLTEALSSSLVFRPDLDERTKKQSGWRTVPLSDVLSPDDHDEPVNPVETYDVAGVFSFGRGLFRRPAITGDQTSYSRLRRLAVGQVVMSRLKAWEGALAVVPASLDGCYVSQEFPTFRVATDVAELRFMERILTSQTFWSELRGASQGIGARRERVSAERLLAIMVCLPPLAEQIVTARNLGLLRATQERQQTLHPSLATMVPTALNAAIGGPSN